MSLSKDLRYIIEFANLPSKEARLSARYSHFQISFWTCFSKKCWPVFSLPLVGQCLVVDPWGSSWGFSGLRSWSPTRSSWAVLWRGWDRCLASKACAPPYHGRTLRALEKEREHRKRRRFQLYFGDITDIRIQWDPAHAMMYGLAFSWIYTLLYTYITSLHMYDCALCNTWK